MTESLFPLAGPMGLELEPVRLVSCPLLLGLVQFFGGFINLQNFGWSNNLASGYVV